MRKEIEEEMKSKYQINQNEIIQHSEEIEVKTKAMPKQSVIMKPPPSSQPCQLTATELLQQSYNEMKKLKQQEKAEKTARFKTSMF